MSAKLFINARVYSLNCAIDTLKTKEKTNQSLAHLKEKIDNYFLNKCFVFPTAYAIIHWLLGGKIGHFDVLMTDLSHQRIPQGQLVGRTGFSMVKVYNTEWRARR